MIQLSLTETALIITYRAPNLREGKSVYLTLGTHREIGSAVLPFDRNNEGSTVFLPFKSDLLLVAVVKGGHLDCYQRKWEDWKWTERTAASGCLAKFHNGTLTFNLQRAALSASKSLDLVLYAKDLTENDAWGRLYGCSDKCAAAGWGDKYIPNYCEVNLDSTAAELSVPRSRLNANRSPLRIYQLFVRLFGNTNETRTPNGTLARNGVGKFNDINDAALKSLRKMGFATFGSWASCSRPVELITRRSASQPTIPIFSKASPAVRTQSKITSTSAPITQRNRRNVSMNSNYFSSEFTNTK